MQSQTVVVDAPGLDSRSGIGWAEKRVEIETLVAKPREMTSKNPFRRLKRKVIGARSRAVRERPNLLAVARL